VKREELLSELTARFVKLGATPDVRDQIEAYNRTLLSIYDKFNMWAYSSDAVVDTKFQLGLVRELNHGGLLAEVYLVGGGLEVKAAIVRYDP
jgi:hypothetical protein